MSGRPISLFTGQWADIPLSTLLPKIRTMGYDSVELACWGGHFDVWKALNEKDYVSDLANLLKKNDLSCFSISNHLVGQAVCDRVDERHQEILPKYVWGNGNPEEVQERAAEELKCTAKAAKCFFDILEMEDSRRVVNGFTGSSIWNALYAFPPTNQEFLQRGYTDFAKRFLPILDVFSEQKIFFALEVHPTEIAFDIATAKRSLEAIDSHPSFGFNYDASHLAYQGVDYLQFLKEFSNQIFHVHLKDVSWGKGDGTVGVFGGHTDFGDIRRFWNFCSLGRGNIDWQGVITNLNAIGYSGPLSVEWEDSQMERFHGAEKSCEFARNLDFPQSEIAFDSAFRKEKK